MYSCRNINVNDISVPLLVQDYSSHVTFIGLKLNYVLILNLETVSFTDQIFILLFYIQHSIKCFLAIMMTVTLQFQPLYHLLIIFNLAILLFFKRFPVI